MSRWKAAGYIGAALSTSLYLWALYDAWPLLKRDNSGPLAPMILLTLLFYGIALVVTIVERRRDGAGIPIAVAGCGNWFVLLFVRGVIWAM